VGLWVGTYGAQGGGGLYPLTVRGAALELGAPEPRIANASFGAWSADSRTAYFVDEQDAGRIAAWRRQGGAWQPVGSIESGGALPCHLSLAPDGRQLAVANYGDGAVALIELDPESGAPVRIADVVRQSGRGPDIKRQDGPHAHCALFDADGGRLYHVDLGLDRVFVYAVEEGKLADCRVAFAAPPGNGPRHLALHPDGKHALLLSELSAELRLQARDGDGFACIGCVGTAPEPSSNNLGGHLALSGDEVLVTNRGHDSVVAFDRLGLDRQGWHYTGGASPRHVVPLGHRLLVAHEKGGSVSLVDLDRPETLITVAVPGAAFIIDIPEE
jgi:6-phosphogluconolactonase